MATQLQLRRGTNTQVTAFTGAEGEVSVNTTNDSLHVHDGSTAGGFELARADLDNVSDTDLNAALNGNTIGSLTLTSASITNLTLGGTAVTSTAAELNILDGVTSDATELNLVDGSSAGTIVNSAAVIYGPAGEVNATTLQIGGVSITSTPAEINLLDGVTATTAELNILDGVTATATEINLLDGVTATTTELNYVDGVTSAIQTQLDAKAPTANPTFTGSFTSPGIDDNGTSTAITIDSSENVLVGTTDTSLYNNTSGGGFHVSPVGFTEVAYESANSADPAFLVNNTGADGDIIQLRKDGTTVGSISSHSGGFLKIATAGNSSGVLFGTSSIYPVKNDVIDDDAVDLGDSSNRFKDLYLSGGAYLGGTAAANKLDDYEEGTWTPITKAGATTITTTVSYAKYVKIGSLVYVTAYVTRNDTGSLTSFLSIEGLPFQVAAGSAQMSGSIWFDNTGTDEVATNYFVGSSSSFYPKKVAAGVDYVTADQFANNRPYYVSGVYQVAF